MDLSQLSQFRKVAELEHITKASLELRVAQPALSKTIRNMEKELEITLFDREKKSIRLNECGKALYRYADSIEESCQNLRRELAENVDQEARQISILFKTPPMFLAPSLKQFLEEHPEAKLNLAFAGKGIPEEECYDFVIDSSQEESEQEHEICLRREEMFLAVPEGHPLAGRDTVELKEAAEEKFICFPQGSDLYQNFRSYCRESGFEPRRSLECDDYATMRRLIESGIGIALVPGGVWSGQKREHLTRIRISSPECVNILRLRWQMGKKMRPVCVAFRKFMENWDGIEQ